MTRMGRLDSDPDPRLGAHYPVRPARGHAGRVVLGHPGLPCDQPRAGAMPVAGIDPHRMPIHKTAAPPPIPWICFDRPVNDPAAVMPIVPAPIEGAHT
ncbi:hypothetical protein GGD89_000668 [Roseospira visakhapatnamensis]|uniref:Uncharacterized protein n=1 Tax=Roseospira visakhapatnamensis TaxID=390880 RepID=A0A7W6RAS9_9PROT|nr:hypothetical protein [Roseospira visakhapatnamensis]